jgi:hypothetical protein
LVAEILAQMCYLMDRIQEVTSVRLEIANGILQMMVTGIMEENEEKNIFNVKNALV